MILTVTLNPAIDISYHFDNFSLDHSNRCLKTIKTAGGKGLNVARVIKQLNGDVLTTGFLGGELGNFIQKELNKEAIANDFLLTTKETRNCIAILSDNKQTEILEAGPTIEKEEQNAFLLKFEKLLDKVEIIVVSGSLPKGIENSFVEKLFALANAKSKLVIADLSGSLLRDIIFKFQHKPTIIKPNSEEFASLFANNDNFDVKKELIKNCRNIEMVLLSLGADGSYFKIKNKLYKINIPQVKCVNPVGSGDSTVAGLAYAIDNNLELLEAVKLANACGISNCMNEKTGVIEIQQVKQLIADIQIEEIKNINQQEEKCLTKNWNI